MARYSKHGKRIPYRGEDTTKPHVMDEGGTKNTEVECWHCKRFFEPRKVFRMPDTRELKCRMCIAGHSNNGFEWSNRQDMAMEAKQKVIDEYYAKKSN